MVSHKLAAAGYVFEPSKYSPGLGYARLEVLLSGRPTPRFFDVKTLNLPTFDGQSLQEMQVTHQEPAQAQARPICLGELSLESYQGETVQAFSFGGVLQTTLDMGDLHGEFTSDAPIFKMQDDPIWIGRVLFDEMMALLAEIQVRLSGQKADLYARLSKFAPYPLFLASLVSLQARAECNVPQRRSDRQHEILSSIKRAVQIVRETDGWDGSSPSLEDLLAVQA